MRRSSRIVAQILAELAPLVVPGVETRDLDAYAERRTREMARGPRVQGLPRLSRLALRLGQRGDRPRHPVLADAPSRGTSSAWTSASCSRASTATRRSPFRWGRSIPAPPGSSQPPGNRSSRGSRQMKEGGRVSDISAAVQKTVEADGFSVIRAFVGHGIGRSLHEEPQVPNFGLPGHGPKIRRGLVLAIEPMIADGGLGGRDPRQRLDGRDEGPEPGRPLRAHGRLTADGIEILSARNGANVGNALDKESLHA